MKRAVLLPLAAALLFACKDGPVEPEEIDDALLAIADGAHAGSIPGFYFLPPLVPQPDFTGEFDPDLAVTVEICVFTDPDCGEIIETFDDIQVADDHYHVNWHTKFSLIEGQIYRITVRVGTKVLGFADVVAQRQVSGKKKDTDPFPLKIGRTLPLKFRIETHIVGQVVVTPAEATIKDNETQQYTATVLDFHGDPVSGVGVEWSVDDETVAALDPAAGVTDAGGQTATTATPPGTDPTLDSPTTVRALAEAVEGTAMLTVEASTTAPTAVDDSYSVAKGATRNVAAADGLRLNDDLGNPPATVVSFGGGAIGGAIEGNPAGSQVPLAGGLITVNADGSLVIENPTEPGEFTFQYRLDNGIGTSDATVTIMVLAAPMAAGDMYMLNVNGDLSVPDGAGDLTDNDDLGFPVAAITSFGGGSLGGGVGDHAAGASAALAGGTLTVNADGSLTLVGATTAGDFTFEYRIENTEGSSDATVMIQVKMGPVAQDDGTYVVLVTETLDVGAGGGLLANDALGVPPATLASFGGGSLGGSVTDHPVPGPGVGLAGGTLTVSADGSFQLATPTVTGTFTFDYRLTHVLGNSDATVTIVVDGPPTVSSTVPANGTANVATDTDITINFSENVNVTASGVTLECPVGAPVSFAGLPVADMGSVTLNPDALLPEGIVCTVTVLASEVTDTDDAPDNMTGDFVFTFTTDAAPTVIATTPADEAADVDPSTDITVDFSEPVNAGTSSFTVVCTVAQAFTLSASPASSFTLNPTAPLPTGAPCVVTVIAAEITDVDAGDPPDNMASDFVFSFATRIDALNDAYAATGNVDLAVPAAAGVLANDVGSSLMVTQVQGVGANVGTPTATDQGGTVILAADGSFGYAPPPGYRGVDTYSYQAGDGSATDDATVEVTVSDMIWFIDNSAGSPGDGRLSSPFNTLNGFNAVNLGAGATDPQVGDAIFIDETGSGDYTGGVALKNNQILIGKAAAQSIATLAGITLAPHSAVLPVTGGAAPSIVSNAAAGIAVAQGNEIHGVAVGNTAQPGIDGINFGSLVVRDVAVTGTGQALDLATGSLDAVFGALRTANAPGAGIDLNGVTGSFAVTGMTNIDNAASSGIEISSSSATFTFGAVDIDNTNGAHGITLSNNTGAVHFGGMTNIDITGGPGAGLTATGGGIITVTGAGSAVSTGSGAAVNITGTTIGAGGMTFVSVSSDGGANGIILSNAGSGGFTVTGTGNTDASGGTIQNKTARGVEVINTDNVTLENLALTNASTSNGGTCTGTDNSGCNAAISLNTVTGVSLTNVDISGTTAQQGINGLTVVNFELINSTITGAGDEVHEGGVRMFDLSGTASVSNSTIASSAERNFFVLNDFPGVTTLTMSVTSSSFNDTQSSGFGADGLEIELHGSSQLDLDVSSSNFLRNRTNGIQVTAHDNAEINSLDLTGNTIDPDGGIGTGVALAAHNAASMNFNIINNPILYSQGGTAVNVRGFATATVDGRIHDNGDIKTEGGTAGSGVSVGAEDQSVVTVSVVNNVVSNIFQDVGIQLFARNGSGTLDATVGNNTVTLQNPGFPPLYGIELRAQDANTTCANVTNNNVTVGGGIAALRVRTSDPTSTVLLQGFATDATTTWNNNGNLPAGSVDESNSGTLATGTCNTVSHPLP